MSISSIDPPAWDGKKVAVLDTDHLWGHGGTPSWAWKSFCRGYNTLLMDSWVPIPGHPCGEVNWASRPGYPTRDLNRADAWVWEPVRKAIGNTRYLREQNESGGNGSARRTGAPRNIAWRIPGMSIWFISRKGMR